ncbi:MAG: hypothetical protein MUE81_14820 [Thermoflexibacter sp.]|nr:hypothetical protein [Thermoflexibacter sp.]
MAINKLILGDCLEVLKTINSESIDLVYIDPPFFSNRTYEVIWGDKGEVRSFEDLFAGGIEHYIAWLRERVQEMHRLLKPTGSIFVHCDWHANAYIRVYILDKIFGYNNFLGEITWQRTNVHNDAKKKLAVLDDTIWYYSKSNTFCYNPVYKSYNEDYLQKFYKYRDEKGVYQLGDLTNTKLGGYHYEYKGYLPNQNGWRCPVVTMKKLDKEGLIHFPKDLKGRLRIKRYLNTEKGTLLGTIWEDIDWMSISDEEFNLLFNTEEIDTVWTDIQNVQGTSSEKIGYPTQKPEALLERIIKMASNEGDTVLDCFMGGGTTIAVADKLNRNWIGIDQSVQAVKVTEFRLNVQQNLFSKPFSVQLHKYDYDTLRYKDAFEFESWIVGQFGGISNAKQRGDLGLDGRTRENQPIQVKRSDNIGRNVIDNFFSAVQRFDKASFEKNKAENKPVGFIIAFSFGKGALQEVARLKVEEQIIIELVSVESIVPIAKKPTLQVEMEDLGKGGTANNKEMRQIQFTAKAQIEAGMTGATSYFYAWDFNYNGQNFVPEVLLDRIGK